MPWRVAMLPIEIKGASVVLVGERLSVVLLLS